jgi:hypothetical protein
LLKALVEMAQGTRKLQALFLGVAGVGDVL